MFQITSNTGRTNNLKYWFMQGHILGAGSQRWIPDNPGEKLSSMYPLRILVVDDNDLNIKLITLQFKMQGYCVDVATDGFIACEMAAWNEYDLICMDLNMPVMDGFEASRKIMDNTGTVEPYIVAVSSCDFEVVIEELTSAGIREFLTKPVSSGSLQQLIIRTSAMIIKNERKAVNF